MFTDSSGAALRMTVGRSPIKRANASELVSRRFSTERLRQSLKVKSRKSTARKSKRADFRQSGVEKT